jgi:comEA protein
MESAPHDRGRITGIIGVFLVLAGLLGWQLYSRSRPVPPRMTVTGAAPNAVPPLATPAPAARSVSPAPASPGDASPPPPVPDTLRVHVVGAVRRADVYTLPATARVYDAVQKAGGATAEADLERVNLADFLKDGEQVRIPRKGERSRPVAAVPSPAPSAARRAPTGPPSVAYRSAARYPLDEKPPRGSKAAEASGTASAPARPATDGKVNLNTATAEQLERLPEIGPALAARILEYRQQHGPFLRIEDILEVRGIGERKFEKIRDRLSVE